MDSIKEAFQKVKEDIDLLREEIVSLKKGFSETKERMIDLCDVFLKLKKEIEENKNKQCTVQPYIQPIFTHLIDSSAHQSKNPTIPTDNPTLRQVFKPQKAQILPFSTGNEGVPTDKQTNRQTDKQIEKNTFSGKNSLQNASEVLDSLDNLKKELRLKFKRLTEQEFLVFSSIYQADEEDGFSEYKTLAKKLNLSESSIRDYVGRIIKKGIPIQKNKINNKNIQVSLSKDFKKIASLHTIMQLREI